MPERGSDLWRQGRLSLQGSLYFGATETLYLLEFSKKTIYKYIPCVHRLCRAVLSWPQLRSGMLLFATCLTMTDGVTNAGDCFCAKCALSQNGQTVLDELSCQQVCVHISKSVQKGTEQYSKKNKHNTVTEDNTERHVCTCAQGRKQGLTITFALDPSNLPADSI